VSFRISRAGRDPHDPWFRIGTLEFTTTMVVVAAQIVGLFVVAAEGFYGPLMRQLPLLPDTVFDGQVWRVATWPFFSSISIFQAFTIFMFWYFGTHLERDLGRKRALVFYGACTLVLSGVGLALSPFVDGSLYGLGLLEFIVLLVFIAEHPHARFFFNIPAWLIGVVFVGIQVLSYIADRDWFSLFSFVIGLYFCAIVARSVGLLGDYQKIPAVRLGGHSGHRGGRAPRRTKKRRTRSHGVSSGPTVVTGPWEHVSKDQAELDALLDKVSQHGIAALTDADRERMMVLRERIRKR